ncbi:hypothetical protein FB567DRAFT_22933 [Paraphoma chrysanthemicola]|uniref:Polynucleotide 5'-hydroxyl-kinase GRC3 n=1 Tax=Paraphoma chrysanthemicola TaxID=798071 RepID=A0A8K0W4D8_9PLEO|nr:hypothetical protein FB567DRAFT_22933 [Paraphoma chrysanthemicola]
MPGKRKRVATVDAESQVPCASTTTTLAKPLSAIAAARLRADASARSIVTPERTVEPVPHPQRSLQATPTPGLDTSDSDEDHFIVQRNLKLCSWRNEPQNILSANESSLIVKLSKHTTISLVGTFRFKVLKGAININGANIGVLSRNGTKDLAYASCVPTTHPISKIRALDTVSHVEFTNWNGPTTLACLSPLYVDIWNVPGPTGFARSFTVMTESNADPLTRPMSPETIPEDWLRVVEECAKSISTILAIGPPKSGKSTLTRRLLNRYLTGQGKSARPIPVVYHLDLDPAKPEFTPHGQVSLVAARSLILGPSFADSSVSSSTLGMDGKEIIRSHPIPSDFVNFQEHYRSCAEDLFMKYKSLQSQSSATPLLITIPGSVYQSSINMLLGFLALFKPHHVIYMGDQIIDTDNATKILALRTTTLQYRGVFHEVPSHSPSCSSMRTDSDLRAMQMQSHFHRRSDGTSGESSPIWSHAPMTDQVPWEFYYGETDERVQDFVGFALYSEPVEPQSLVHVLSGSIVQIVESTSSAIPAPYTSLPRTNKFGVPYFQKSERTGMVEPLDPKTSRLICTALVRGFDTVRKVVQLLVPKLHEDLLYSLSPERTIFVAGCCDNPEWAFIEDAHVAALTDGSNSHRALATPWVEGKSLLYDMGYLNMVRRVRKFKT